MAVVSAGGDEVAFSPGSFDSLSAVEFASSIGKQLDLDLPNTLLFDYPSIRSMAQHIHSQLASKYSEDVSYMPPSADTMVPGAVAVQCPHEKQHQLIFISAAGRLPAGAASPVLYGAYGADGICRVPFERWDIEAAKVRLCLQQSFSVHQHHAQSVQMRPGTD